MLTLSINKKLDYSCPIMFVPLGTTPAVQPTTATKPTTTQSTQNKIPVTPIKQTTNKTVPAPKPTTVATTIPKKAAPVKQEVAKVDVKKPEPVKQDVAQKTNTKKEVAKAEPVKPTPIAQALDTQQTVTPIIRPEAHVSHNYREVEALRKQAQLQKEIVQKWSPPVGVSPNCMCEVSFFVTSTGKIENIKMVKSSGVVMFDISARQALFAMKMPQWTYGKPLIISFKE